MTAFAYMLCCWCGFPRECTKIDIGWVCNRCRDEAEGIRPQEDES